MKSKDFTLIGAAIVFAIIFSILISRFVFSKSSSSQQVDIVPPISSSFPAPDQSYFNNQSIDPTTFINIGNNQNPSPFGNNPNNQ